MGKAHTFGGQSVSMGVRESKAIERKVRFSLHCFIWECNPKAARVGEKKMKQEKKGNHIRWTISTLATVCHAPDTACLLTDLVEKLCLEGRRKKREWICLLPSWFPVSIHQSLTCGQLASQPFQVATFSPFGILWESQIPHPAAQHFMQVQKRQEKLHCPAVLGLVSSRCWNHLDSAAETETEQVAEGRGDTGKEWPWGSTHAVSDTLSLTCQASLTFCFSELSAELGLHSVCTDF